MLVLTRKPDQFIMIGDLIKITVAEVKGNQVRLAIHAPGAMSIHRAEIWEKIKNNYTHQPKAGYGSLVLTRKPDQSIYIDNDLIKIMIVEVKGEQVRIGIAAPKDLPIYRQEIYKQLPRLDGQSTTQMIKKGPAFSA